MLGYDNVRIDFYQTSKDLPPQPSPVLLHLTDKGDAAEPNKTTTGSIMVNGSSSDIRSRIKGQRNTFAKRSIRIPKNNDHRGSGHLESDPDAGVEGDERDAAVEEINIQLARARRKSSVMVTRDLAKSRGCYAVATEARMESLEEKPMFKYVTWSVDNDSGPSTNSYFKIKTWKPGKNKDDNTSKESSLSTRSSPLQFDSKNESYDIPDRSTPKKFVIGDLISKLHLLKNASGHRPSTVLPISSTILTSPKVSQPAITTNKVEITSNSSIPSGQNRKLSQDISFQDFDSAGTVTKNGKRNVLSNPATLFKLNKLSKGNREPKGGDLVIGNYGAFERDLGSKECLIDERIYAPSDPRSPRKVLKPGMLRNQTEVQASDSKPMALTELKDTSLRKLDKENANDDYNMYRIEHDYVYEQVYRPRRNGPGIPVSYLPRPVMNPHNSFYALDIVTNTDRRKMSSILKGSKHADKTPTALADQILRDSRKRRVRLVNCNPVGLDDSNYEDSINIEESKINNSNRLRPESPENHENIMDSMNPREALSEALIPKPTPSESVKPNPTDDSEDFNQSKPDDECRESHSRQGSRSSQVCLAEPDGPLSAYIISGFQILPDTNVTGLESIWTYWSGARLLYQLASESFGLRRMCLYRNILKDESNQEKAAKMNSSSPSLKRVDMSPQSSTSTTTLNSDQSQNSRMSRSFTSFNRDDIATPTNFQDPTNRYDSIRSLDNTGGFDRSPHSPNPQSSAHCTATQQHLSYDRTIFSYVFVAHFDTILSNMISALNFIEEFRYRASKGCITLYRTLPQPTKSQSKIPEIGDNDSLGIPLT